MRGPAAVWRLALAGAGLVSASRDVISARGDSGAPIGAGLSADEAQRLAVVVPAYQGDLDRAVASLERWPTNCSPLTVENVDLVLYYAEGEEDRSAVEEAAGAISASAGKCFAHVRTVYAHLDEEEDAYPKGPSVMFFKMFLDEGIRSELSEYDSLAIIEWDVLVASDRSFEELYHAAFRVNEPFWVKGSNLEGTNFHSTSEVSEMWRVLGHINGNAIYNNNDPAFVEYVEYTRARWEYKYPYDVALWLTISDFPYSWPLYQRYSSKFVITNLISYVGYEHVTHDTVSDAIAGQTLFIHGSRVDEGSGASMTVVSKAKQAKQAQAKAQRRWRRLNGLEVDTEDESACRAACGNKGARSALPDGTSTVCDPTCGGDDGARFDGFLCGAGDAELFGDMCRLCYVCPEEARKAMELLPAGDARAVIMCDTMEPPISAETSFSASGCFDDLETALIADDVAKRHGSRAIMCSTMKPPAPQAFAGTRRLSESNATTSVAGLRKFFRWSDDGKLSKEETSRWQAKPKWAKLTEWMADSDCDTDKCPFTNKKGTRGRVCDPSCATGEYGRRGCNAKRGKFGDSCRACFYDVDKALKKDSPENRAIMCDTLKPVDVYTPPDPPRDVPTPAPTPKPKPEPEPEESCDAKKCPFTNKNGKKGRVCDPSCSTGEYGTYGCAARRGRFGDDCRTCFNDVDKALKKDTPENRAIMCDTLKPVDVYDPYSRRLSDADDVVALASKVSIARQSSESAASVFDDAASAPFEGDIVRGELCAFVAGRADEVDEWTVTVNSIQKFAPGMRVAVAAEEDAMEAYERAVGSIPGVTVSSTADAMTASLYADEFCGVEDTRLIMYVNRGTVFSRYFTSKDTHSPKGDLLVVYGSARASYRDSQLAKYTASLLGSDAALPPSFTYGTDLILPVGANKDLRDLLASGDSEENLLAVAMLADFGDRTAFPQVLAALQFVRKTEGIWFLDPQTWVSQHLFKEESIWDIPLVKPRFTCAINPSVLGQLEDLDVAGALDASLDFFSKGGKCQNGQIDLKIDARRA